MGLRDRIKMFLWRRWKRKWEKERGYKLIRVPNLMPISIPPTRHRGPQQHKSSVRAMCRLPRSSVSDPPRICRVCLDMSRFFLTVYVPSERALSSSLSHV
ncbi:MAG: hypothetical protein ACOC44_03355 [Promethearchaeia archaeon]